MKVLSLEQKRQVAEKLFAYIKDASHLRDAFVNAYAEQHQTTAAYCQNSKMTGKRPLTEMEADWCIETLWGMTTTRKIREVFALVTEATPEQFGFNVPDYLNLSDFQKFKIGLGKIAAYRKTNQSIYTVQ